MSSLDLSTLPEAVREKLQARLDRLPPELRDKLQANLRKVPPQMLGELLERGSPMLDRVLAQAEEKLPQQAQNLSGTIRAPRPPAHLGDHGFYNKTIQRGDRLSLPVAVIVLVVGSLLLLLHWLGLFQA